MATVSCDTSTLASQAACFKCLGDATNLEIQAFLLCQILQNGAVGVVGQIYDNNLGGNPPTDTPAFADAIQIDNSNGTKWYWYKGAWH